MADIDTKKTDYAKVRAIFQVDDNAPHEPLNGKSGKKAPVPGQSWFSRSRRWIRFFQSLSSKWPGWPRFWQSRVSGWPVAMIFGLYVYYLLVFVMLPTNVKVELKKPPVEKSDMNASSVISQIKQGIDMNCGAPPEKNQTKQANDTDRALEALLWENQKIGMYSGGATFAVFASSSYFSTYVRCYMLLVVPGLFTGRGRALLMTISVGLLLDGPIANLHTNIKLVNKAFLCMFEQTKVIACKFKTSYSSIFDEVTSLLEDIHNDTEQQLTECAEKCEEKGRKTAAEAAETVRNSLDEKLAKRKEEFENKECGTWTTIHNYATVNIGAINACNNINALKNSIPDLSGDAKELNLTNLVAWAKELYPDMDDLDINKANIGDLLQSKSTASIKEKLVQSSQSFFEVLQFVFSHIKVILYSMSLLYMLYQANQYLVKYLSDDSFDNMFVNDTLDEGYPEKLLPLRRWEAKEKYKITTTTKLSNQEYKKIGLRVMSPMLFFLATVTIILADHFFGSFIDVLKKHGKVGISFNGMEQGIKLNGLLKEAADGEIPKLNLKLEAFDLSTDPCLPVPVKTDWIQLVPLIALVGLSLVSCFLDAYIQRLRSQICNLFYPERALNRTVFLRKKISTGRGRRSYQLKLVATQRKKKHDQLLKISYRYRFECWFYNLRKPSMTLCHGCKKETKKKHIHEVSFDRVIVNICEDCKKDVPQRMGTPVPLKRRKRSAMPGTSGLKKIHSLTARFVNRKPGTPNSPSSTVFFTSTPVTNPAVDLSCSVEPMPSTSGSGSGPAAMYAIDE